MMLDLKPCDIVDPPYLNAQIHDLRDLEEYVQSPQNLIEAEHKVYCLMEKNQQDAKVKHLSQFYSKYRCSLKYHCSMANLILSIASTQVENECNFSIAGFFSRAQQSSLKNQKLGYANLRQQKFTIARTIEP